MSVELQQIIDKIHNKNYSSGSWRDTRDRFPGLDTRSCNCAFIAGIDTFAKGRLLMTKAPHEVLFIPNAGQSTMQYMLEYFVNNKAAEWIPDSLRTEFIATNLIGFRTANITEDEWQYLTNKWFKSDKAKLKAQSKHYIAQLKCIYAGESMTSVANRTNRCSSTVSHQMRKAVRILNAYIQHLPTYKVTRLLEGE